ncbi:MAG: HTTM domain-containing protein [Nanoarchaeota archaeon]
MIKRIEDGVKNVFGIDARALSIFRICLALILIFDLIVRSFALVAHYTDYGVLPLDFYNSIFADTGWVSIHIISGGFLFQSILFMIAGLFAILLLLGYKTRLATIVSWFLLISLHSRNPTILQGGDIMLRVLLFWAMFLPLNLRYSLDAIRGKVKDGNNKNVVSFGTAGILLQVAFVYFFSALLKTGNEWFPNGTAIYYALQLDQFATHLGKFLLNYPDLMFGMTHFVYFLELIGPILLFVPFFFKQIRIATTFAFLATLIGMALFLNLGHFPFVGIVAFILFLPSAFWDKISNKLNFLRDKKLYYYELDNIKINWKKVVFNLIAFFFIIYILLWNIQTLGKSNAVPDKWEVIAQKLRIDQYWNMFSPFPLKEDGWYVIDGELANGDHIDLLTDQVVTFEKPHHVANLYTHERWRKYLMNMWDRNYEIYRSYYLNYLCKDYNMDNEINLTHITMNFMVEITGPDYQIMAPEKVILEEVDCNSNL